MNRYFPRHTAQCVPTHTQHTYKSVEAEKLVCFGTLAIPNWNTRSLCSNFMWTAAAAATVNEWCSTLECRVFFSVSLYSELFHCCCCCLLTPTVLCTICCGYCHLTSNTFVYGSQGARVVVLLHSDFLKANILQISSHFCTFKRIFFRFAISPRYRVTGVPPGHCTRILVRLDALSVQLHDELSRSYLCFGVFRILRFSSCSFTSIENYDQARFHAPMIAMAETQPSDHFTRINCY